MSERDVTKQIETRKPLLEIKDLVTRFDLKNGLFGRVYGRIFAVENVSFNIYPGEIYYCPQYHAVRSASIRVDQV
jgi:ABC-type glutathione transport system ATPase component